MTAEKTWTGDCATTGCTDPDCYLCTVIAKLPSPGALLTAYWKRVTTKR